MNNPGYAVARELPLTEADQVGHEARFAADHLARLGLLVIAHDDRSRFGTFEMGANRFGLLPGEAARVVHAVDHVHPAFLGPPEIVAALRPRLVGGEIRMPVDADHHLRPGSAGVRGERTNDVGNGLVKAFVFGILCTVVALYQGHETEATPEGVAYATTRTVVISSLWVLGMDFVLTALMFSTP